MDKSKHHWLNRASSRVIALRREMPACVHADEEMMAAHYGLDFEVSHWVKPGRPQHDLTRVFQEAGDG